MHPILAEQRRLVLYLLLFLQACWILVELLRSTWTGPEPVPRPELFAALLPLVFVHAFSCLASFYLCRTLPLGETRDELLAGAALVSALLASGGVLALGVPWLAFLVQADMISAAVPRVLAANRILVLVFALFLYLLSMAVHYVFLALARSRQAEARAFEARILAGEAELQALRAQVDPHFLFNSLNSIAALVGSEPKRARKMCGRLAAFMRRTLQLGGRDRIPLADELALADDYLSVERIRFGERLRVDLRIDDAARPVQVPPLVLQPLVENAVRHGVAQRLEGGEVTIIAERRQGGPEGGGSLRLEVSNPCEPDRRARGGGVGLDNVRRRLRAAWGDDASLDVEDRGESFRVRLTLPIERGRDRPTTDEPDLAEDGNRDSDIAPSADTGDPA